MEHLIDPWSVLARYRPLLKDDGQVIASIPNIRHYRVLKKLLSGRWDYEEKGILDSAHLRFFTKRSIKEMFQDTGHKIDRWIYKLSASRVRKLLNKLFAGILNEILSEQFLIVATKSHNKK